MVAGIVLLTLASAIFWWHWTQPSPEESESRLKQAAPEIREQAIRSLKQAQPEVREQFEKNLKEAVENTANTDPKPARKVGDRVPSAAPVEAKSTESNKNPAVDDSILLRFASTGHRLSFAQEGQASSGPAIVRLDLAHAALTPIVTGGAAIAGPQPSPDGKQLVFMAGTTHSSDIWVCDADGSHPKRLTSTGKTGTPRWSPDGHWIAFDSDGRFGRSGIYIVSADGGAVRPLVEDTVNNSVPSWSRDGKYIYFASNRGDGWESDQVWKVPVQGGQPVQLTHHGGFSGFESMDGQTFYYAKHRYQNPEIWQVSANGGDESRVSLLHPTTWASWALTKTGILLLSEYSAQVSELQYFDFATRSVHSLATLEKASFWLASSANGSSIWYSELTDDQARQVFKAGL